MKLHHCPLAFALLLSTPLPAAPAWLVETSSTDLSIHGSLKCLAPPTIGHFEPCQLALSEKTGSPINVGLVVIKGGMPTHGHGLPTSPQAHFDDMTGHYIIKGLKFSMPGPWVLDAQFKHRKTVHSLRFEFQLQP